MSYYINSSITSKRYCRNKIMQKRRTVKLDEIRRYAKENGVENVENLGIMALIEIDNMGFTKDGKTRWYHFEMNGEPCVYYKY